MHRRMPLALHTQTQTKRQVDTYNLSHRQTHASRYSKTHTKLSLLKHDNTSGFNIISCAGLLNIPLTVFHNYMSTPFINFTNIRLWLSKGFRATPANNIRYCLLAAYPKWSDFLKRYSMFCIHLCYSHKLKPAMRKLQSCIISDGVNINYTRHRPNRSSKLFLKRDQKLYISSELHREQCRCSTVSINFELFKPGCSKPPLNRHFFSFLTQRFFLLLYYSNLITTAPPVFTHIQKHQQ